MCIRKVLQNYHADVYSEIKSIENDKKLNNSFNRTCCYVASP
jgi:hypothetical protein